MTMQSQARRAQKQASRPFAVMNASSVLWISGKPARSDAAVSWKIRSRKTETAKLMGLGGLTALRFRFSPTAEVRVIEAGI